MLHGVCFGEEAGARDRWFFGVKWQQAVMKGIPCVCGGCGCDRFIVESVPPLCSAMCIVHVCVFLYMRLLHL